MLFFLIHAHRVYIFFFANTVEDKAIASGGTIPDNITAAITGLVCPCVKAVKDATPKKYAAFPQDRQGQLPSWHQE